MDFYKIVDDLVKDGCPDIGYLYTFRVESVGYLEDISSRYKERITIATKYSNSYIYKILNGYKNIDLITCIKILSAFYEKINHELIFKYFKLDCNKLNAVLSHLQARIEELEESERNLSLERKKLLKRLKKVENEN